MPFSLGGSISSEETQQIRLCGYVSSWGQMSTRCHSPTSGELGGTSSWVWWKEYQSVLLHSSTKPSEYTLRLASLTYAGFYYGELNCGQLTYRVAPHPRARCWCSQLTTCRPACSLERLVESIPLCRGVGENWDTWAPDLVIMASEHCLIRQGYI